MNNNIFKELTIVIPTYNEEKNISLLLEYLSQNFELTKIIIVDDDSSDNTINIIKNFQKQNRNLELIVRTNIKKGLTISVLEGIKKVKTKYFLVIDGDMQHPPGLILEMLTLLINTNSDIIVGYKESVPKDTKFYRNLMTYFGNLLGKIRLSIKGKSCKDILSGFFCCKTKFFLKYADFNKFENEGYKILFDFLKQVPKSTKLINLPFVFGMRISGNSKLKMKQILIFF